MTERKAVYRLLVPIPLDFEVDGRFCHLWGKHVTAGAYHIYFQRYGEDGYYFVTCAGSPAYAEHTLRVIGIEVKLAYALGPMFHALEKQGLAERLPAVRDFREFPYPAAS